MILPILIGCLAATVLLGVLAWKLKKFRKIFVVLAVIALLPTLFFGCIVCGAGELVNYPGQPTAPVTALVEQLAEGDHTGAEYHMVGSLGLDNEEVSEDAAVLLQAMTEHYAVTLKGRTMRDEFMAQHTAVLTHLDMDSWFADLPTAVESELFLMVQETDEDQIFTADGKDYLDGVREEAYAKGLAAHLEAVGDYVTTTKLEVNLCYTPGGWLVVPDAALVNAFAGFTVTEEAGYVFDGDIAAVLSAKLTEEAPVVQENLSLIPKIQMLAEDALCGEVPNPDGFGATTDPNEVLAVIEQAGWLLNGQDLCWSPDLVLKPGSEIQYYLDDSILVIVWQEVKDRTVASFAEVKIANGTQIRRALSYDKFYMQDESPRSELPTVMAKRANAVVAISGDYYRYRQRGICVYQGKVYRNETNLSDSCLITRSGDLLFLRQRVIESEDVEAYVEENDVKFSLAFGPVLIDEGKKEKLGAYGLGEIYEGYDRCAFGKLDDLHYLLMTVTREGKYRVAGTLEQAQGYLYEKGCVQAYTLDGGQTCSLVFNGELVNNVNYGGERFMSDIMYFASAVPGTVEE